MGSGTTLLSPMGRPMALCDNREADGGNARQDKKVVTKEEAKVTSEIVQQKEVTTYEIVVTLFHGGKKAELGEWLLAPEIADIPVTIIAPDPLFQSETKTHTYFQPELAFSHLLNRTGRVQFVPMLNGGKGAGEAPGYNAFILNNYETLPDVTIFLHANPSAHSNTILKDLEHVRQSWTPEQIGFLHLNYMSVCRPVGNTMGREFWPNYYRSLGFDSAYMPYYAHVPCCAQFMVAKERILLRPKWFYQQLMKMSYMEEGGLFSEHFWHVFFGESPLLSDDRQVKLYALSNWTRPIEPAVLHNPYPNEPYALPMKVWYDKAQADPATYYPENITDPSKICPGKLFYTLTW
jgi:hypothetical protein